MNRFKDLQINRFKDQYIVCHNRFKDLQNLGCWTCRPAGEVVSKLRPVILEIVI